MYILTSIQRENSEIWVGYPQKKHANTENNVADSIKETFTLKTPSKMRTTDLTTINNLDFDSIIESTPLVSPFELMPPTSPIHSLPSVIIPIDPIYSDFSTINCKQTEPNFNSADVQSKIDHLLALLGVGTKKEILQDVAYCVKNVNGWFTDNIVMTFFHILSVNFSDNIYVSSWILETTNRKSLSLLFNSQHKNIFIPLNIKREHWTILYCDNNCVNWYDSSNYMSNKFINKFLNEHIHPALSVSTTKIPIIYQPIGCQIDGHSCGTYVCMSFQKIQYFRSSFSLSRLHC